jgi:predicted extracellular nuclease
MKKFYLLMMAVVATVSLFAQCSKPYFSEYVEGSGSNKALEIYNPTNAAVVLDGYKIQAYSNGGVTPSGTFNLTGNLAAGSVYVVVYSSADTLKPYADTVTTSNAVNFNGDDAIVLLRGIDTLDIVGVIGQSQVWPVGAGSTQNKTLVRNTNVKKGNTDWSVAVTQWSVLPQDSVQLGAHTGPTNQNACALSPLPTGISEAVNNINRIYPNPNNGNFTIELNSIENSAEVTLFDLAGRMVYYTKENSSKLNVSTGSLTAGMYIVEVKTGNLISRIKVSMQ